MSDWFKNIDCPKCNRVLRYSRNTENSPMTCFGCKTVFVPVNVASSTSPKSASNLRGTIDPIDGASKQDSASGDKKLPRWAKNPPVVHSVDPSIIARLAQDSDSSNKSWATGEAQPFGSAGQFGSPNIIPLDLAENGGRHKTLIFSAFAIVALVAGAIVWGVWGGSQSAAPLPAESTLVKEDGNSAPTEPVVPPAPTEPASGSDKPVAVASLDPKRTYAEQIEAENGCESTVYVSSLIGMAEFDKRYLSTFSRQDSNDMLEKDLANVGEKIDDAYEAVRILQVQTSMDSNKDGLWDHRPMFTVNFPNLQHDGVKVSVYVDVPKEAQQYMSVTNVQPVSFGTGILLSKEGAKEKCDFNSEKNQFELPLDLHWNLDALLKLEVDLPISLNIRVVYEGDGTTDPFPVKITVKPAEQIEHGYPLKINFATLIDSGHPWIKKLINDIPHYKKWINNDIKLIGGGGGDDDKVMSAYLVWEELVGRKISYQSFTGGDFQSQRARRVHETLETRNGNCADGSILFASFFEAIGLDTYLVIPRGHMYVAIFLEKEVFPIETTDIGKNVSQTEYENIKLHPLLEKMVQRHKWLEKDAAFRSFALAVSDGVNEINEAFADLEKLEEKLKDLHDGPERDQVLIEIEHGIQLQYLRALRRLGIGPIGTPQGWAEAHKLPRRETPP